ncbi:MAG: lipoyl(octanoyl) transferase LipB [Cellvibrionaceae bacterium]
MTASKVDDASLARRDLDSQKKRSSTKNGLTTIQLPKEKLLIKQLGLQDYQSIWDLMSAFTDAREADTVDELWLVEHHPVFTLGKAGKSEHVLNAGEIPIVNSDRGGQVTYHGPGQLIAYPLLDLHRKRIGVRELVELIEESLILTLKDFNISAERKEGAPGVYVNDAKIAALGLRVRKGRSFHGMSLNVNMDLEPFARINPCGYAGLAVTQMSNLTNQKANVDFIADHLTKNFCSVLNYQQV